MFLCMDEYGNVYQAASHRADGRGVERMPEIVEEFNDNTLDNTYKKHAAKTNQEHRNLKALNSAQDAAQAKHEANKNAHAEQMRQINVIKNDMLISKANQKALLNEAKNKQMGNADFDRLRITDANYGQKHAAALQYLQETMGTSPSDIDYSLAGGIIPDSGKSLGQINMEMEANSLLNINDLTKEFAEYQTVMPNSSVDLSDANLQVTKDIPYGHEKKKLSLPVIAGGLAALYLIFG